MRHAKAPHPSRGGRRGKPARQLSFEPFTLGSELDGVEPGSPCRTTRLARFTPPDSCSGSVRGIAVRRGSQAAPRCRRCKPDPTRHSVRRSAPRPCQLAMAARLARRPVPARSPRDRARRGLGRQMIAFAHGRRMPVGDLVLALGGLGAAASEARQGVRSGNQSGPYGLDSGDSGERRERCLRPRKRTPLGVPAQSQGGVQRQPRSRGQRWYPRSRSGQAYDTVTAIAH